MESIASSAPRTSRRPPARPRLRSPHCSPATRTAARSARPPRPPRRPPRTARECHEGQAKAREAEGAVAILVRGLRLIAGAWAAPGERRDADHIACARSGRPTGVDHRVRGWSAWPGGSPEVGASVGSLCHRSDAADGRAGQRRAGGARSGALGPLDPTAPRRRPTPPPRSAALSPPLQQSTVGARAHAAEPPRRTRRPPGAWSAATPHGARVRQRRPKPRPRSLVALRAVRRRNPCRLCAPQSSSRMRPTSHSPRARQRVLRAASCSSARSSAIFVDPCR